MYMVVIVVLGSVVAVVVIQTVYQKDYKYQ